MKADYKIVMNTYGCVRCGCCGPLALFFHINFKCDTVPIYCFLFKLFSFAKHAYLQTPITRNGDITFAAAEFLVGVALLLVFHMNPLVS